VHYGNGNGNGYGAPPGILAAPALPTLPVLPKGGGGGGGLRVANSGVNDGQRGFGAHGNGAAVTAMTQHERRGV